MAAIVTASLTGGAHVLIVSVPLAGDGTNPASTRALADLRGSVLPATLGKVSGITYNVAGTTAASHDFSAALDRSAPVVFAFVPGLAFLLLMMAFLSLAIPATAIGLNPAVRRRRIWRTVRPRLIREVHCEQAYMWECWWCLGRTASPEATGELRWDPPLDGRRPAGSYLRGPDQPAGASRSAPWPAPPRPPTRASSS
ncbi:MAG: MMPL family transporter [Streptosporangiaceae bacterium]